VIDETWNPRNDLANPQGSPPFSRPLHHCLPAGFAAVGRRPLVSPVLIPRLIFPEFTRHLGAHAVPHSWTMAAMASETPKNLVEYGICCGSSYE